MKRKRDKESERPMQVEAAASDHASQPQALVIGGDARLRRTLGAALNQLAVESTVVTSPDLNHEALASDRFDLVILLDDGNADLSVIRNADRNNISTRFVVVTAEGSLPRAVAAMRAGASDYIALPADRAELADRLAQALGSARSARAESREREQLRAICKRLNHARLHVTEEVDSLCTDLVSAYQELAEQVAGMGVVTEFSAIIQQELDVEELLRTTLEYFLRKFGAMNAAVYLPGTGDEFSLGAYINYDLSPDSSDYVLDHMADVITPLMIEEPAVREFHDAEALETWVGQEAMWLGDSHVITFSCRDDEETLAIFVLFRSFESPFEEEAASLFTRLRDVFTRQLAHVIRVHHRHLPDDGSQWKPFGDEEDHPDGLAA